MSILRGWRPLPQRRPFSRVARQLGGLPGSGQCLFPVFQFGNVAIDCEQRAVVQRFEVEFDVFAAHGTPLEAATAGLA